MGKQPEYEVVVDTLLEHNENISNIKLTCLERLTLNCCNCIVLYNHCLLDDSPDDKVTIDNCLSRSDIICLNCLSSIPIVILLIVLSLIIIMMSPILIPILIIILLCGIIIKVSCPTLVKGTH